MATEEENFANGLVRLSLEVDDGIGIKVWIGDNVLKGPNDVLGAYVKEVHGMAHDIRQIGEVTERHGY